MTASTTWRIAGKSDRVIVRDFTCCRADHPPGRPCTTPWAHEVQTYIRQSAITECNRNTAGLDQRMLLVFDGLDLVGAAVHALSPANSTTGRTARALVAYAVQNAHQGKPVTAGRPASVAILDAVVDDVASRHHTGERVYLLGWVHQENHPSRKRMETYGFLRLSPMEPADGHVVYGAFIPVRRGTP